MLEDEGKVGAAFGQGGDIYRLSNINCQQAFCLTAVAHQISVPSEEKCADWSHSSPGKALDFMLLLCLVACFN